MLDYLRTLAEAPLFEETGYKEFPCDYEDTYDLGVRNGRTQLAREILKSMVTEVEAELDEGPAEPISPSAVRIVNSMLGVLNEEFIQRDEESGC